MRRGHSVVRSEAVCCWLRWVEIRVEGGLSAGELSKLMDLLLALVLIICEKLVYSLDFFMVFHIYTLHLELSQPLSSVEIGKRGPGARSAGAGCPW